MAKAQSKNAKAKAKGKIQKKKVGKTKGGGVTKKWVKIKTSKKTASKALGNTKPQPHMGKVSLKPAMKCGDFDTYGNLQKKNGQNKYDRDHIPSKAAIKKFAEGLYGRKLTGAEASAIDRAALAIAIPKGAHKDVSPTYGGRNTDALVKKDAANLPAAAKRDVNAMKGKVGAYSDADCAKKYEERTKAMLKMKEADYEDMVIKAVNSVP